jgi:hypothetical protein
LLSFEEFEGTTAMKNTSAAVKKIGSLSMLMAACVLGGCGGAEPPEPPSSILQARTSAQTVVAPADAYYPALQQVYIAYFGRPADPAGLEFFARNLAASGAPTEIRALLESAASNSVAHALFDAYGSSQESKALYGTDTTAFLTAVYRNVLGRTPEPAGLAYWKNAIDSKAVSQGSAAVWILASAIAPGNPDGSIIRVKLAAASAFTAALDSADERAAYAGAAANDRARAFLAGLGTNQKLAVLPGLGQQVVDDLVVAAHPNRIILRGTVATGNPISKLLLRVRDQVGDIGTALTGDDGSYEIQKTLERPLVAPLVYQGEYTQGGKKKVLYSISTNDKPGGLTVNVTPITDMIARAYATAVGVLEPAHPIENKPEILEKLKAVARKVLAPLLPAEMTDPIDDYMIADPQINEWDNASEKLDFARSGQQTTISAVDGRVLASVTDAGLATDTVSDVITAEEANHATAARGPLTGPVAPYVNPDPMGAPAGLTATRAGGLKYRLTWQPIPGVSRYFIFQQKDAAPLVSAGTYPASQLVPFAATIGGSGTEFDFDYQVEAKGLYYWVVAGVVDDGLATSVTIGAPSNAASLQIDDVPADISLASNAPCSEWRKILPKVWNEYGSDRQTTLTLGSVADEFSRGAYQYQSGNVKHQGEWTTIRNGDGCMLLLTETGMSWSRGYGLFSYQGGSLELIDGAIRRKMR